LFLICQFLKFFVSENALLNHPKLSKKHLWQVPYKNCFSSRDPLTNMTATGDSFLRWNQMAKWNFVWSIYRRCYIKIAHFVRIDWQEWPPQAILVCDWSISIKIAYFVWIH
jgi:hypothetical protein